MLRHPPSTTLRPTMPFEIWSSLLMACGSCECFSIPQGPSSVMHTRRHLTPSDPSSAAQKLQRLAYV